MCVWGGGEEGVWGGEVVVWGGRARGGGLGRGCRGGLRPCSERGLHVARLERVDVVADVATGFGVACVPVAPVVAVALLQGVEMVEMLLCLGGEVFRCGFQ